MSLNLGPSASALVVVLTTYIYAVLVPAELYPQSLWGQNVTLCSPGWLRLHCVPRISCKFGAIHLLLHQVLGLQV